MKTLEKIHVVNFYLFEAKTFLASEVTGVFGPNASGKSSLLDAVQVPMFGGNVQLMAMNAQADNKSSARSLRSYCLGQIGDGEGSQQRDSATTYVTLVWRDEQTGEPTSMGVCLYADNARPTHEVRGRYLLRGVELSLSDHLISGGDGPRDWESFRNQVKERHAYPDEECLFSDADRFIRAYLMSLRGAQGAPLTDAFTRAFRFAMRMQFGKSVDQIIRQEVLEDRPTRIQRFKDVRESFRRLSQLVQQTEARIAKASKIQADFDRAHDETRRQVTWNALAADVQLEQGIDEHNAARDALGEAEDRLETCTNELNAAKDLAERTARDWQEARDAMVRHAAYGALRATHEEISSKTTEHAKIRKEFDASIGMLRRTLSDALASNKLKTSAAQVTAGRAALEDLGASVNDADAEEQRTRVHGALRQAAKAAEAAFSDLTVVARGLNDDLKRAKEDLTDAEENFKRVQQGKAPLSQDASRLLRDLQSAGVDVIPVCDLVTVRDADEWQRVIEGFLGARTEALLVRSGHETKAHRVYRESRGLYGLKIAMESRYQNAKSPELGSVASLLDGPDPAAVAYLRAQFGAIRQARTDAESLSGQRTLTPDGMLVSHGEIDRIRPANHLRLGLQSPEMAGRLRNEISRCSKDVERLTTEIETLNKLMSAVRNCAGEPPVTYVMGLQDKSAEALRAIEDAKRRLAETADEQYGRLVDAEEQAKVLKSDAAAKQEEATTALARADEAVNQRKQADELCQQRVEQLRGASNAAKAVDGYDPDYSAAQWDRMATAHPDNLAARLVHCGQEGSRAQSRVQTALNSANNLFGSFVQEYREDVGPEIRSDWRKGREWITELVKRLTSTELAQYREQMDEAFKAAQETFRNDVAIALANNLEWLADTQDRMNKILRDCPAFSNGERYQFQRRARPQYEGLERFVKSVAANGASVDLFDQAGDVPPLFRELLDDEALPGTGSTKTPLDDYREFYEFDIVILREDPVPRKLTQVSFLSKRLGTGSGGEHRAPLYVIAGASLASAYRLDGRTKDGLRLMLIDEAFNKMDEGNIVATVNYLTSLGLQIVLASPGENQGILTAFLHRYYDIARDPSTNYMSVEGHTISQAARDLFRQDLPQFNPESLAEEERKVIAEAIGRSALPLAAAIDPVVVLKADDPRAAA